MGDWKNKKIIDRQKYIIQTIDHKWQKIGVYEKLLNMSNNMTTETSNSKKIYFDNLAEKLSDPKLNRKAFRSIIKFFTSWKKKMQLFLSYS